MNKKLKEWLFNLGLILFGILIFFIILEIGLTLKNLFLEDEKYELIEEGEYLYYPKIGIGLSSNRTVNHTCPDYSVPYSTNSIGFRDKEHTIKKNSNVFRIIVLGDSFVQAIQVPLEQTFPYLLEQELNANPNSQKEIEVINLGWTSLGTDQEYLILKYIGLQYNPDLVILAFYTQNDVKNNYVEFENNYMHVYQNGNIPLKRPFFVINETGELEELPFQRRIMKADRNNLNMIFNILMQFRSTSYLYSKIKNFHSQKISKECKVNGVPIYLYVYAHDYSADWQEAWNITKALILKVDEESKENEAQFLLVSLTNRDQVHNEYWQKALETYPEMKNMEWDLEKTEKILTNFSAEHNITYLQLLPLFRECVNLTNEKVHGHFDGHWNTKGHKLAAELIYDKLIEEQLIPLGGEQQYNGKTRNLKRTI